MNSQIHLFERTTGGSYIAPVSIHSMNDPFVKERLGDDIYAKTVEELEIIDTAGEEFNLDKIKEGKLTPVFFGSAMNNFGVQLLLDGFLDYAVPPVPRNSTAGIIQPEDSVFSGFIFKIQANMDPKHRDRIAFMRICSGKFNRDMQAVHAPSGKKIRLSNSQKLFGQERETIDEAVAGDIVGFVGNAVFGIGDTITENPDIVFKEIPRFAPEHFVMLHNPNPGNYKKFRDGLDQLLQEGVIQAYYLKDSLQKVPVLGAVGPLQFEVVQYRLEAEYGAESRMEQTNWKVLRWMDENVFAARNKEILLPAGAAWAADIDGLPVILFTSEWSLNYFYEKNKNIELSDIPVVSKKEVA
jgi:peptide chain release factor 3